MCKLLRNFSLSVLKKYRCQSAVNECREYFFSPSDHVIFCLLYKYQWNTKPFHLRFFEDCKSCHLLCSLAMAIFSRSYFSAWRNQLLPDTIFFFQLTFLDMIMYIIFKEAELPVHAIRWTRVFRPLFLVNISEGRQVKIVIVSSRHSDNRWWCKVKKVERDWGE